MSKNKKLILKRFASIVLSFAFITVMALPVVMTNTHAVHAQGTAVVPIDWGLGYTDEIGLPQEDVRTVIVRIIKSLLGFLGVAALIIILIGGVEWMTAGGSDDKVKTAQKRIGYGVIGLVIIFVSYALTTFIFEVIFESTSNYPTPEL